MKKNLYIVLTALAIFVLTACQATPTPTQASGTDFYKKDAARWLTVDAPKGWVAKPGNSTSTPSIIVTDDWVGYQTTNTKAIGILIVLLDDKGSAEDVLRLTIKRFDKLLTLPTGEMKLEQANGQNYAKIEYQGKSAENENLLAYYFLTVIGTDKRNVLIFTSVSADQEIKMKTTFEEVVKGITVH